MITSAWLVITGCIRPSLRGLLSRRPPPVSPFSGDEDARSARAALLARARLLFDN